MMNAILLPRYMVERPALDLRIRQFERQKHGMVCIGTWFHDPDTGADEPCLALLHAGRPVVSGRTVPVIIPLSEAWRWAMHGEVGDPEHCGIAVSNWLLDGLLPGNPHSARDRIKVLDAINESLSDLIAMPPAPRDFGPRKSIGFGEMSLIDASTGATVAQREVKSDV